MKGTSQEEIYGLIEQNASFSPSILSLTNFKVLDPDVKYFAFKMCRESDVIWNINI